MSMMKNVVKNPALRKFWDGVYDNPKELFDPNDEARSQAEYLISHPEIQALASLFIAHMARQPVRNKYVLEAAGNFFTRPADVMQAEIDEALKKLDNFGPKEEMEKKYRNPNPHPGYPSSVCECPSVNMPSIESFYSSFISKSSSATTLPSLTTEGGVIPTLDEALWELVIRSLNNALNNMYVAREHELNYDTAYLCIMTCAQTAVEATWIPRVQEIQDILEFLIDDVRRITREKRNLQLLMTNKLPIKVNRLKNNFKGYAENVDYPKLKKNEILETLESRQCNYNRYPKDRFGVYIPAYDKSLDMSTTHSPRGCEEEEISIKSTDLLTLYDDLDEDEDLKH